MVIKPGVEAVAAVYEDTTPQMLTSVVTCVTTEVGETICPRPFNVPVRQRLAPTTMRLEPSMAAPAAIGRVRLPMAIEPGEDPVAAVYAETWPQTLTVVVALAVTVEGTMSCPRPLTVPLRQRSAPSEMRLAPLSVVPTAIGNVWPAIMMEPGVVAAGS